MCAAKYTVESNRLPKYTHMPTKDAARIAVRDDPDNFPFIQNKLLDFDFTSEMAMLILEVDPSRMFYFYGYALSKEVLWKYAHINPTECVKRFYNQLTDDLIFIAIKNDPTCIKFIKEPKPSIVDFAEYIAKKRNLKWCVRRR
jgi:hypothetical protein